MGQTPDKIDMEELTEYLKLFNTKELKDKFSINGRSRVDIIDTILRDDTLLQSAVDMFKFYKSQKYAEETLMNMKTKQLCTIFGVKSRTKAETVRKILSNSSNKSLIDNAMKTTSTGEPLPAVVIDLSIASPDARPIKSHKKHSHRSKDKSLELAVDKIRKFKVTPRPARRGIPTSVREKVWRGCNTFKVDGEYRCSMDGKCFCCNGAITYNNHQSGHIISDCHGGEISLSNLKPICASCNKNMGSANMLEYMFRMGWTDNLEATMISYLGFYQHIEQTVLQKSSKTDEPDPTIKDYLNYKKVPLDLRMNIIIALLLP